MPQERWLSETDWSAWDGEHRTVTSNVKLPYQQIGHLGQGASGTPGYQWNSTSRIYEFISPIAGQIDALWRVGQVYSSHGSTQSVVNLMSPDDLGQQLAHAISPPVRSTSTEIGVYCSSRNGYAEIEQSNADFIAYPRTSCNFYAGCWFQSVLSDYSGGIGYIIVHRDDSVQGVGFAIYVDVDNVIKAQIKGVGNAIILDSGLTIDSEWHNVMLVSSEPGAASNHYLFIDNVLVATENATSEAIGNSFGFCIKSINIGDGSSGFAGAVDEIIVGQWTGSLSNPENYRFVSASFVSPVVDTEISNGLVSQITCNYDLPSDTAISFAFRSSNSESGITTATWSGYTSPDQIIDSEPSDVSVIGSKGRYSQIKMLFLPSANSTHSETPVVSFLQVVWDTGSQTINLSNAAHQPGQMLGQTVDFSGSKTIDKLTMNFTIRNKKSVPYIMGDADTISFQAANFSRSTYSERIQPATTSSLSSGIPIWSTSIDEEVDTDVTWRFVVFGDTRSPGWNAGVNVTGVEYVCVGIIADHMISPIDFVMVTGDLAYTPTALGFNRWKNAMSDVYDAGIPVYPMRGNHDVEDPPGTLWTNAFSSVIPDNGPVGEINFTYAVNHKNAMILLMDQYINLNKVNQAWIDEQIEQNNRDHIFVLIHAPAFKWGHLDCMDDYPEDRDVFWQRLEDAGVRAVFVAHDHAYSRARIDNGDGNTQNDIHQIICGTGGGPFIDPSTASYNGDNSSYMPIELSNRFYRYGYCIVEINNKEVTITFKTQTDDLLNPTEFVTYDTFSYTKMDIDDVSVYPSVTYEFFVTTGGVYDLWGYGCGDFLISFDGDTSNLRTISIGNGTSMLWTKFGSFFAETGTVHTFTVYFHRDEQIIDQWYFTTNKNALADDNPSTPLPLSAAPFNTCVTLSSVGDTNRITLWKPSSEILDSGHFNYEIPVGYNTFIDGLTIEYQQLGGGPDHCCMWNYTRSGNSIGAAYRRNGFGEEIEWET